MAQLQAPHRRGRRRDHRGGDRRSGGRVRWVPNGHTDTVLTSSRGGGGSGDGDLDGGRDGRRLDRERLDLSRAEARRGLALAHHGPPHCLRNRAVLAGTVCRIYGGVPLKVVRAVMSEMWTFGTDTRVTARWRPAARGGGHCTQPCDHSRSRVTGQRLCRAFVANEQLIGKRPLAGAFRRAVNKREPLMTRTSTTAAQQHAAARAARTRVRKEVVIHVGELRRPLRQIPGRHALRAQ